MVRENSCFNVYAPRVALAVAAIVFTATAAIMPQLSCRKQRVTVYDAIVNISAMSTELSGPIYCTGVKTWLALMSAEQSPYTLDIDDNAFLGVYNPGNFDPNDASVPPDGSLKNTGFDYVVVTSVEKATSTSLTDYVLSVCLQTVADRTIVKNIKQSVTYSDAAQASASIPNAITAMATQLTPLKSVISAYEKTLIDKGPPYASDPRLMVSFQNIHCNPGTKNTVTVEAFECGSNGQNLGNRTVQLIASGCTLDQDSVILDQSGSATIGVTAGQTVCVANVRGILKWYYQPRNDTNYTDYVGTCFIGPPPSWQVEGSVTEHGEMHSDTSFSADIGGGVTWELANHGRTLWSSTACFVGWFDPAIDPITGAFYFTPDSKPMIDIIGNGSTTILSQGRKTDTYVGLPTLGTVSTSSSGVSTASGPAMFGKYAFFFSYDPAKPADAVADITVAFHRTGTDQETSESGSSSSNDINDTTSTIIDAHGTSISVTDSGYVINSMTDTSYVVPMMSGQEGGWYYDVTTSFTGIIRDLTGNGVHPPTSGLRTASNAAPRIRLSRDRRALVVETRTPGQTVSGLRIFDVSGRELFFAAQVPVHGRRSEIALGSLKPACGVLICKFSYGVEKTAAHTGVARLVLDAQ